jgi:hypothetical protein
VPLFDAADGRTLAEVALRSITDSTARARGDDFLRILVRDLARRWTSPTSSPAA